MLVITIMLGVAAAIFTSLYFLLKKDLKTLNKDIVYRLEEESRTTLVTDSSSKEVEELLYTINNLFLEKEDIDLEYRKIDHELKENIANISHDLRTPLTAILGYCDLLLKSNLPKESREYVEIINKKSKSLHHLIDDFYDFSRIISKDYPISLELIDVGNLLKEVLFEYYEDFVYKDSQIDIQIPDEDIKVISDEDALKRIFSNLISNMLHHGTGQYRIRLFKKDKSVHISFENQVTSIDIVSMERIFERSYTMNSSRSPSKSGLGLSIVKELVYRLNHDLDFNLEDNIFKMEIILKMEKIDY